MHAILKRLPVILLVAVLAGCAVEEPTGTVTGTVTLDGQPVEAGQITFISKEGFSAVGSLGTGGTFTLEAALPLGTYTVCVSPPELTQAPGGDGETEAPEEGEIPPTDIPEGYFDEGSSDLKQEVTEGPNTVTVELKASGPAMGDAEGVAP